MATRRFDTVWDAIEPSRTTAHSMRLRAELANEILEEIARRALTQARAATLLGVSQPRISDLSRGRLDLFSLDTLVDLAARLQLEPCLTIRRAHTG